MIRFVNVSKKYILGDGSVFTALDNISVEIKEGEFVAIIGPSGSGKSTLMHLVGLLDKPTGGQIFIDDKDVSRLSDNQISAVRNQFVGFVFQQFNLLPKLTILENVLLPSVYSRKKGDNLHPRAEELLTRFGIIEKKNSYPNKISGGQQQRVAIARALIMKPKLILADEPTGNLDTKTGQEIINLLKELNKEEGITVVIVTHDPEIAKQCRRQIRIVDGKIVPPKTGTQNSK